MGWLPHPIWRVGRYPACTQLLCDRCNRTKGDRDQAYLVARLKETVITS